MAGIEAYYHSMMQLKKKARENYWRKKEEEILELFDNHPFGVCHIAKRLNIGRNTVRKYLLKNGRIKI
jgi:hypothetical protein